MCHVVLALPLVALPVFWLLPLPAAIGTYGVVLVVAIWIYWYAVKAWRLPVAMGPERIIGSHAVVLHPVDRHRCRVRIDGETWQADCGQPLAAGDRVRVASRHGLVLRVERIDSATTTSR